ncbi:PREDICTED: uncharacterized protein LOC104292030 [Charadrius vociferus]|uniref:uncharacterized protein LOC104292030 n=1 Tax=Charadrius vociferus TaxID=50402 RepID=UPI000521C926|nr:PREDICTED: uncharacterized protein LOC104292030 [Charadrius vociferus]
MLVQVVALLSLGLLCSSAPMPATGPTGAGRYSPQEERSRALVGLIIREVLQDMQKLNLNAVPSVVTVNATVERCMHSHLKTFSGTLAALDRPSKVIARKLATVNAYKNILPKIVSRGHLRGLSGEAQSGRLTALRCPHTLSGSAEVCSGVSSYFLPLKETPHVQNKAKSAIIDEMLCLLKAENEAINESFSKPLYIKNRSCAHYNTKNFIKELEKIPTCKCMKTVEQDMIQLEKTCPMLKKPSSNDSRCSEMTQTNFTRFKESLEEFLKWINGKQNCSNIVRSESGLYPDGKCHCPDLWKSHQGVL